MNVYYCKTSKWEVEYFQNEVFKKEVYGIDVNFIFFLTIKLKLLETKAKT